MPHSPSHRPPADEQALAALVDTIREWAKELGFDDMGISDIHLESEAPRLQAWLDKQHHGDMTWLAENAEKRLKPNLLHAGTCRVICVRMNYLPGDTQQIQVLKDKDKAYVSRYALGRDYHKLIRKRLATLAERIEDAAAKLTTLKLDQRPFVDSAPVLERPLAKKAGLGWVGKHTLILNEHAGSWFFLGELFTNLPLPVNDKNPENKCGDCTACLKVCPTDAFPRPYELDARRCISYLTIENKGAIPLEFREAIGNRVFGCDDCQAICPWNKFAKPTCEDDFKPRHGLEGAKLIALFEWDEKTFLDKTAGSPIRRIGYERWLRNLAIGLGNATPSQQVIESLQNKRAECSSLVQEHIDWAIAQHMNPPKTRKRKIKRATPPTDFGEDGAHS